MQDNILPLIGRTAPLFEKDIAVNEVYLSETIHNSRFLVIGGAGTIGSAICRELFARNPKVLHVIDISENNMVELVRDIRSSVGYGDGEFATFALDCGSDIFRAFINEQKKRIGADDYVFNTSALKHVRSEKDPYTLMRMIDTNIFNTDSTMLIAKDCGAKKYFCVSTDKAANPVNIMGASKRIMEDLVMAYNKYFKVTTARFANVAFSNGSLPDGWIHRLQKKQPLVAPSDVKRYFVSPEESGQICMLACILGNGGEVFFPKLGEDQMLTFSAICDEFVKAEGFEKKQCANDAEAVAFAANMGYESETYPVVYFGSDTTGEKSYEEFYVPGEKIDMQRFQALGVVEQTTRHEMAEVNGFFDKLEGIFAKEDFTKAQVVDAIKEFIPNFEHEEKGKNLDQKM
jgi:FlaA1/EpsC-like NDP-sugar epimerase